MNQKKDEHKIDSDGSYDFDDQKFLSFVQDDIGIKLNQMSSDENLVGA